MTHCQHDKIGNVFWEAMVYAIGVATTKRKKGV